MEPIRAVVFDLDGTLIQTEHLQFQGWLHALKPYGKSFGRPRYPEFCGKNARMIEEELIREFRLPAEKGELIARKEEFLHAAYASRALRWVPFARQALRFFGARAPIAVATSSARWEMELKLGKIGYLDRFAALACMDDVSRGKPFPDIYEFACRKLGVRPCDALAFEDTGTGVQSAAAAGLRAVAIPNEFAKGQDYSRALMICKDFREAMRRLAKERFIGPQGP